ncbi:hypothetical protein Q8F55_001548 [Vanrija albida]|uniref:Phospholipid scramblase n=1 Tax=Vanrija albida TaxID=181172 RepID=A0ABR3QGD7_9TREE
MTLTAVSPPIVIDDSFVHSEVTTVIVDDVGRLSGDSFFIKDPNGKVIISAAGPEYSTVSKKTITDAAGKTLYEIKGDIFTLKHAITGKRDGHEVFRVKFEAPILANHKSKFEISLETKNGVHEIEMVGDWKSTDMNFVLKPSGQVIATAAKDHLSWGFEEHKDQIGNPISHERVTTGFYVQIAPGIDVAAFSSICMCVAMINHSHHTNA